MSRVSIALSFAAVVVAITPAAAADMYGSNSRAPSSSYGYSEQGSGAGPAASWNGGYVGGQAGYGWGDHGSNGAVGGIYGGYNAAVAPNVVLGGEADINLSGQEHSSVEGGALVKRQSNWNGSLRARVGVTFDKAMPYATAGIALADDTVKANGANDTTTKLGYVVGAGVEGKISDQISIKGELLRTGFGRTDHVAGATRVGNNVSGTTLRAGAAFHF